MLKLKCSACGKEMNLNIFAPSKLLYTCPHCNVTTMIRCDNEAVVLKVQNLTRKKDKADDIKSG